MKALVFHAPKKITVDNVPDPRLEATTDALIRVTSTSICGSDLHIYNGFFPQRQPLVMGHEFMGVVLEVGKDVKNLKPGDRVVVPFCIACGRCWFCEHDLTPHCETTNRANYGPEGGLLTQKGGGLFGYTDMYGGYPGGQAQYVRVPFADFGPRKVPESVSDEQVLFLSDIFPTGYLAVDWAKPKDGDCVVVLGCGPVGIMAMKSAWLRGAGRVIGVDLERYRLQRASEAAKAEVLNLGVDDVAEVVRDMTGGRGADVVIDAVGLEAHRTPLQKLSNVMHLQAGSMDAVRTAIRTVRRGGTISIVGVYGAPYDNFPLGQLFDKGIGLKMGQAPVHAVIDRLLEYVIDGRVKLDDVISHRMPLEDGPKAYELFNRKQDDCVKVVLRP